MKPTTPRLRASSATRRRGVPKIGFAAGGFFFQREHELPEMPVPMPRGKIIMNPVGEGEQAHRIALPVQKPCKRGSQSAGIIGLE